MSFSAKLFFVGIVLLLFTLGFGYYQTYHPWPTPFAMYPCLFVVGVLGLFLYKAPKNGH